MPGKVFRRLAPAIALTFFTTLLTGFPAANAVVNVDVSGNPDLNASCGLEFALVIDRSGSVAGNAGTVKAAANTFLEALVDTGSKVSLTSFATDGRVDSNPLVNNGVVPLTTANLAGPTGLTATVNGLSFANFTNWEDGLIKAQSTFPGFSGGKPDLVVMITDGNPNRYINGSGVVTTGTTAASTAEAKTKADAIKLAPNGSHMFTLGVTGDSGLNLGSLQAISGLDNWPINSFEVADWTTVTSFTDLKPALLEIATELCGGTVIVQKLLDGNPAEGWHFTASGSPAPVVTPDSGDTDENGMVQFDWDSAQNVTTTLTETIDPGYAFAGATCARNNDPATAFVNGGQLVVGPLDTIRCTFNNRTLPAHINVEKSASADTVVSGGPVTYTYVVTNDGDVPLTEVTLVDDECSPVVRSTIDAGNVLSPDESWTYTCVDTLTETTTNTATASGKPPVGANVSDIDTPQSPSSTPTSKSPSRRRPAWWSPGVP